MFLTKAEIWGETPHHRNDPPQIQPGYASRADLRRRRQELKSVSQEITLLKNRIILMYFATPWRRHDLFFLRESLRSGRPFAEVAGFLSRSENEVREKAEDLGITKVKGRAARPCVPPDKVEGSYDLGP
jgi:hypothetical protein